MPDRIMNCPKCGKSYNISTFKPGMKFRCTGCGTVVTVPGAEEAAPVPAGRRSRRPPRSRRRVRRPVDYEEEEDFGPRRAPKKSDNTMMIGIGVAVGAIVVMVVIFSLFRTSALSPTTPPPYAIGTNTEPTRTANWNATPEPTRNNGGGTSSTTDNGGSSSSTANSPKPGTTGNGNNGGSTTTTRKTPAKKPSAFDYRELKDCPKEIQDFVKRVVEKAGGEDAWKFNSTWKMQINIRTNCYHDPTREKDPFSWLSETDMPSVFFFKRAGTVNKIRIEQRQSSRRYVHIFDGKKYRKFIDQDEADLSPGEQAIMANDAYDMDLIYKLASGRFLIAANIFGKNKYFRLAGQRIPCNYIKVQDRFDPEIKRQLFFYRDYLEMTDLLAKVVYDDKVNNQHVTKFYWDYGTKKGMTFPYKTLILRGPLDGGKAEDMEIFQIFKEDDEELGSIEFGVDIPDYLFERAGD